MPEWDELDWARVKDLQLRNILDKRREAALAVEQCTCLQCPNFVKHVRFFPLGSKCVKFEPDL